MKILTLRMPIDLYEKVARLAKKDRRSIHAEILYILESFLKENTDAVLSQSKPRTR